MPGSRPIAPRLALAFGAFFAALLVAELALRIGSSRSRPHMPVPSDYPGLFWTNPVDARVPGTFPTKVEFRDYPNRVPGAIELSTGVYSFNSLGLHDDREFDPAAPRRRKVVLCIGDSTTLGALVSAKQAYPRQLEGLIHARVLNAGVMGYNLAQYLANARRLAPIIKPDVLVVGLYMNDAVPWPPHQPLRSFLLEHSRLYEKIQGALDRLVKEHRSEEELSAYLARTVDPDSARAILKYAKIRSDYTSFYDDLRATNDLAQWTRALADLDALKVLCNNSGIRLIAAIFPAQFQTNFGYRFPEPQRTIAARMKSLGIPHCDMTPAFRRESQTSPIYPLLPDVAHFNARGHLLTAECLAPLLRRALLTKSDIPLH